MDLKQQQTDFDNARLLKFAYLCDQKGYLTLVTLGYCILNLLGATNQGSIGELFRKKDKLTEKMSGTSYHEVSLEVALQQAKILDSLKEAFQSKSS